MKRGLQVANSGVDTCNVIIDGLSVRTREGSEGERDEGKDLEQ